MYRLNYLKLILQASEEEMLGLKPLPEWAKRQVTDDEKQLLDYANQWRNSAIGLLNRDEHRLMQALNHEYRQRYYDYIKQLNKLDLGAKVTYFPTQQEGMIKGLHPNSDFLLVVYNCSDDWKNFQDYTAEKTPINDLLIGWDWNFQK